jgi:hypothetical protein
MLPGVTREREKGVEEGGASLEQGMKGSSHSAKAMLST